MRHLRLLACALPLGVAAAAEPTPASGPQLIVEVSAPDLDGTRARWVASQLGRLASAPEMAPLWASARAAIAGTAQAKPALDLLEAAWPGTRRLSFQMLQVSGKQPAMVLDLQGPAAPQVARALDPGGLLAPLAEELPIAAATPERLTLASPGVQPAAGASLAGDLVVRWSVAGIAAAARTSDANAAALCQDLLADGHLAMSSSPEGMDVLLHLAAVPAGLQPADRRALSAIPVTADAAFLIGIDGPAWWAAHKQAILGSAAAAMSRNAPRPKTADEVGMMASTPLAMLGMNDGLDGLASAIRGTVVAYVDHGLPSIGLEHNQALDQLIAGLLRLCQATPPTPGTGRFVVIPGSLIQHADVSPAGLFVANDGARWWLSLDAVGIGDRLAAGAKDTGFAASECGKRMASAPAGSQVVGAVRSRDLLRSLVPMAGIYASIPAHGNWAGPVLHLAQHIVSEAGVDAVVGAPGAGGWELRSRGSAAAFLGTGVAPVAIIAAIAIPNLLESKITANESAAAATLKAAIFPAEVQFQGGAYQDADHDNVGEFGLLGEMSGRTPCSGLASGKLRLLAGPLANPTNTTFEANGYRYAIYLPDGHGGAISDAPRAESARDDAAAANDQERYWVAYAWPAAKDTGRRMFAMCADGQLREMPWKGQAPAWNAVFGGAGFDAAPVWPVRQR